MPRFVKLYLGFKMKLLRKAIRGIILENLGHYAKIATLLCTKDPDSINQGLELAKAMGYIESGYYPGPGKANWKWQGQDVFNHQWSLSGVDEGLSDAIEKEWEAGKGNRLEGGDHRMWRTRSLDGFIGWEIRINGAAF